MRALHRGSLRRIATVGAIIALAIGALAGWAVSGSATTGASATSSGVSTTGPKPYATTTTIAPTVVTRPSPSAPWTTTTAP
jgi:hypothetical protein